MIFIKRFKLKTNVQKALKGGYLAKFIDVMKLDDNFYFEASLNNWLMGKIFNTDTSKAEYCSL